jgi:hypothetical protein
MSSPTGFVRSSLRPHCARSGNGVKLTFLVNAKKLPDGSEKIAIPDDGVSQRNGRA